MLVSLCLLAEFCELPALKKSRDGWERTAAPAVLDLEPLEVLARLLLQDEHHLGPLNTDLARPKRENCKLPPSASCALARPEQAGRLCVNGSWQEGMRGGHCVASAAERRVVAPWSLLRSRRYLSCAQTSAAVFWAVVGSIVQASILSGLLSS